MASCVNAVNRIIGAWFWPHVSQEFFKAVAPLVTDSNSPCSISGITNIRASVTARFHRRPCFVLGRMNLPMSRDGVYVKTATTTRAPLHEIGRGDLYLGTAITLTCPANPAPLVGGAFKDNQSAKSLSGQISEFHVSPFCLYHTMLWHDSTMPYRRQKCLSTAL